MRQFIIILCTIFVCTQVTQANDRKKVYYAGVSFVGNFADNKRLYPHSIALSQELNDDGLPVLEQTLLGKVKTLKRPDADFIYSELGDHRGGDAITLAFAVDWENISVEKIGGLYKIVVDLHAQILLFDYASMKIIGSYPVAVQLRDAKESAPDTAYLRSLIRSLYMDQTMGVNIFDAFTDRLMSVPIQASYGTYLRVGNVEIEDKALSHLPSDTPEAQRAFKTLVAQTFGKYLSQNQNVSLLPYTKGEAIGSKMALRFSNGDTFNLTIPKADFGINLAVRGFKKVKAGENHAKVAWVYGSFVRIHVEQPDVKRTYLNIPFKHAAVKEVPISQTQIDDWSAFQESLFGFFDAFTREVSKPSKKWLKKATSDKKAAAQLAKFTDILNKSK